MRSAPKKLQTIREHSTTRPPTVANVKSNNTNVTATEVSVDISLARRNLADDDSTDASPTCGDEIETCLLLNKSEHEAGPTEDRVGGVEFVDGITDVEESPLLTASAGNFCRRTSAISARDDKDCSSPINNTDDMGSYFFYDRGPLLLPKTFTEPSNLNELLKQASASLHKKIRRSTIVSPVDEEAPTKNLHNLESPCRIAQQRSTANRTYGSRSHYSNMSTDGVVATAAKASSAIVNDAYGYIDDDFESVGKKLFKNQLLQGGSSSFHLRQKDISTNNDGSCSKINDTCGQCPRCSRHGRFNTIASPSLTAARFIGDTSACPCRICRLLDPDTSPSLFAPTTSSRHQKLGHRDELGALCQMCGHSEVKTSTDGRCSRFVTSAASGAADDVHSTPDVNGTFVAASNSFTAGLITCREQGVQVSKWSLSSVSSCSGPLCRICHSPGDKIEALMSPCRCSGSLKFVHMSCLLRWLEISRRKLHRAPHCELCGYKYQRHKIMRFRRFQCPPCSRRDKVLHVTFVLSILIMIVCACTTIIFFKGDKHSNAPNSTKTTDKTSELSGQEIVTLICGVMFFCAFFLAMYVQVKAQATIYKLMMRFWIMNQEWHIEEYRRDRDIDYRDARNNVSELGSDV